VLAGIPRHPSLGITYAELDHAATLDVCREIAMNAHRWTFERPTKRVGMGLKIPPAPKPGGVEDAMAVKNDRGHGNLVRFYRQNRWANEKLQRHPALPEWRC
jgi:hypothetical protein